MNTVAAVGAADMDSRMRSRRISVRRAEGRRRRHKLLAFVVVVVCCASAFGVSRTRFLDVDRIVVSGLTGADAIAALHAAGLSRGLPMLDIDSGGAAMAIEALPWVASADVSRRWPSVIEVEAQARIPVAVVPAGAGLVALVDAYGYVIGRQSEAHERRRPMDVLAPDSSRSVPVDGLPLIAVPFDGPVGEVHRAVGAGLSVVAALPDDLRAWVDAVTVDPRSAVRRREGRSGSGDAAVPLLGAEVGLALVGGASVTFGEAALLDDKVKALRAVLAGVELDCIVSIDLAMADQIQIFRHPDCPPQ